MSGSGSGRAPHTSAGYHPRCARCWRSLVRSSSTRRGTPATTTTAPSSSRARRPTDGTRWTSPSAAPLARWPRRYTPPDATLHLTPYPYPYHPYHATTPTQVSRETRGGRHTLVLVDRVFEHAFLGRILRRLFGAARGARFKSDDATLNLVLLSLQVRGRGRGVSALYIVVYLPCIPPSPARLRADGRLRAAPQPGRPAQHRLARGGR